MRGIVTTGTIDAQPGELMEPVRRGCHVRKWPIATPYDSNLGTSS